MRGARRIPIILTAKLLARASQKGYLDSNLAWELVVVSAGGGLSLRLWLGIPKLMAESARKMQARRAPVRCRMHDCWVFALLPPYNPLILYGLETSEF